MKTKLPFLPLLLIPVGAHSAQVEQRPNILWLTFEDTSPQFIGCYGDQTVHTPVIDGLSNAGIRFTNAFSTGTVSSPSRFCLITGCRPTKYGTGNHRSSYEIPEFIEGFPKFLRDAGYYTSNNSKTDYNHKQHRKMTQKAWNESSDTAGWRKRKSGQPFFSVFNSNHSHQSRTMTNPWELYEKQVLRELSPERVTPIDGSFEMPTFYRDSPEMRKHLSRVYNSISLTDQHFGEILKQLEIDGLRDSTIIFCFSDHGEGIPRGKGSSLGMGYRVPFILWIPEMYKHLSPWGSGVITEELVSFEDFGATVLALAGVKPPSYIEGENFIEKKKKAPKKYVFGACDASDSNVELSRSVTDGRYMYTRVFTSFQPFVRYISYYDHGDIQKQMRKDFAAGLLDNTQSEIMQPRMMEYLYDLQNDKWETHNLAQDTRYKGQITQFRKVLKQHLIENKDANFIPEYTLSKKQSLQIPYYLRQDKKAYPVQEVIEAALLCGQGQDVIRKQIQLLEHSNEIVTYWAAMGLFCQQQKMKVYLKELVQTMSVVTYEPARILLAATILNIEENSVAQKIIEEGIMNENKYLSIYALNALVVMDLAKAQHFIPVVQKLNESIQKTKGKEGVESMLLVTRLRLENREFRFKSFW